MKNIPRTERLARYLNPESRDFTCLLCGTPTRIAQLPRIEIDHGMEVLRSGTLEQHDTPDGKPCGVLTSRDK